MFIKMTANQHGEQQWCHGDERPEGIYFVVLANGATYTPIII